MNPINLIRGLFAAALLLCAAVAQAGVNSWTLSGPEGGWAYQAAFHPTNSQIAVLSTVRGLYRTTDGSAHWTLVNDGANGPDVAFDPTNGNRVLHAANTLWLSMDAGQTFSLAQSPTDYAGQVEFAASGTVYLGAQNSQIYRSTDHANTWTACGSLPASSRYLYTLAVDPNATNAQDHLFVSVSDGTGTASWTYRSIDGCATWLPVSSGDPSAPNKQVYRFAVKPGNPNRVLAATTTGIWLSTDGGANWTSSPAYATWVEFDPHNPRHVIALGLGSSTELSTDDGDTWNALYGAGVQNPGTAASFAFDTVNAGRILMATYIGPFLSTDGGLTFSPRNSGLHASYLQDISTSDDGTVYATFSPGVSGVFRRDPSTLEWSAVNNAGLALAVGNTLFYTSHVATAPTNSSLVYAGAWNYKLARSNDGGANWQAAHPTFAANSISTFDTVVDPDSALVAYSATDHGVWKTTDGGTTWAQANTGLPAESHFVVAAPGSDEVYAIADDPASPNVNAVYKSSNAGASWSATGTLPNASINYSTSISIDPSNTNVVYVTGGSGLAKSVNGGASWTAVAYSGLPGGFGGGQSLLIDPVYSTTIMQVGYPSFVARSVDGGANWEPVPIPQPGLARTLVRGVLDPLRPSVIIGGLLGATSAEYEVASDLSLTVTGLPGSLATSSSVSATLTVKNLGPHSASPQELDVTVPGWLTPTVPGGCTRHLQTLHCVLPALLLNETSSLSLPLAVSAAGGTGQVTAHLTTHEADTDSTNNDFSLAVTGSELADLSLSLTPSATAIDHDGPVSVTAVVVNHGPSPSTATTLSLPNVAGLTINSFNDPGGSCTPNGNPNMLVCTLGTLASGASTTVTLTGVGSSPGLLAVSGHADGAGTDRGTDQDATTSVTVRPVGDASIELAESADPVRVGTSFRYTATLRNLSGDSSDLHLALPVTGATVRTAAATSGTCTASTSQVDCDLTALAVGASATVTVDLNATSAGIAAANATLTYAGTDTSSANNTANIGTTLRLEGDLAVTIAESADPATAGVSFDYTVTVLNNGPNDGGVHLSVPVTGATVASASMAGATCTNSAGTVTCDLATLAKGAAAALTITVSSATAGSASATATATFSGTDLVPTNDSATANTTVASPPVPSRGGGGSSGGGGGGGSFDWLWLTLLGTLGAWRIRSKRSA